MIRWPIPRWGRKAPRRAALEVAPLTLGRHLAACRALGPHASAADPCAAAEAGALVALVDALTPEGAAPVRYADEAALRAHAAALWAHAARGYAAAAAEARARVEDVERWLGHFLEDGDGGAPPFELLLGRLSPEEWAALRGLPLWEAFTVLRARSAVAASDEAERKDRERAARLN